MIGLMTYEEGSVQLVRIEATASVSLPLTLFQQELEQLPQGRSVLNERQRTCAALLNDSHFAVQDEAVFVLLISAVEVLCDQKNLPQTYVDAVQSLQDHLAGLTLDAVVRKSLEGTLEYAKKQSLRQAYLTKFRTLLDYHRADAFDQLYKLRSTFVHEGGGRGDLRGKIGEARELRAALFAADLASTQNGSLHQIEDRSVGVSAVAKDKSEKLVKVAKKVPSTEEDSPSQSIDARIAALNDWRGATLARVRELIKQADPEMVEDVKWRKPSNAMLGVPVWEHDGIICTGETYKVVVKLTFAKGASLEDPSGLFNASREGNTRRAIDIREGDKLDEKALKALIRAAVALNISVRSQKKPKSA